MKKNKFIIYKHTPPAQSNTVHIKKPHYDYRFTDPRDNKNAINFFSEIPPKKLLKPGTKKLAKYEFCPEEFFKEKEYEIKETNLMTSGKHKPVLIKNCDIKKLSEKLFEITIKDLKLKIIFGIFSVDICLIICNHYT